MRILFTCAFIELLASYDNANHDSYLLIFFPARYKACNGMWKFSQLSAKIYLEKITQNKVCIYPKLCMYGSEFSSLWALILGIEKMANIIDFRFKVHNKSNEEIFKIKIAWQTSVKDAIPTIKKEMATR